MSEGGHWYRVDGTLCGPVPNKTKPGEMRAFTKTDADKEDPPAAPGVSRVLEQQAKPGLVRWQINEHLRTVADDPNLTTLAGEWGEADKEQFIKDVAFITQARMDEAPGAGSAMHLSMLRRLAKEEYDPTHAPFIAELVKKLDVIAPLDTWACERSFYYAGYEGLTFGGTSDLPNFAHDHVADLKTQEFGPGAKKQKPDIYFDWAVQLAAYEMGLEIAPTGRRLNLIASRTDLGLIVVKEWSEEEMRLAREQWRLLLKLWWASNRPDVYFAREKEAA